MITGIDHILIAVEDLEIATETYQALGFEVLQGGKHPKMGTHNALVPLADGTYLELIGVWDRTLAEQAAPEVVYALTRETRLATFALASEDLDGDLLAIRARGLDMENISEGERLRPDGQRVAWRRAAPTNIQLPFLLQDVTPHELRIPLPTTGIGRSLQMGDVNVGVRDVPTAALEYQKLLGMDSEDGWFELPRGAIVLQDVDTERVLQLVLQANVPLDIVEEWKRLNVEFNEQLVGGIGITLEPVNTLGAPIQITGRVS